MKETTKQILVLSGAAIALAGVAWFSPALALILFGIYIVALGVCN